jgi:hypothetical protein
MAIQGQNPPRARGERNATISRPWLLAGAAASIAAGLVLRTVANR